MIVGDKEIENGTVSITARGKKKLNDVPLSEFVEMCRNLNRTHAAELL